MRLENYIEGKPTLNENIIKSMLSKIKNKSINSVLRIFKDSWLKLTSALKDKEDEILMIINKNFDTKYRSFDQISKAKPIMEGHELNEDWKHYWEMLKSEGFPTLSFYPALTAWIEIGKILEPDMQVNWTKFGAYALFWLLLVSGRFIKEYRKWKKENPDQYYAERPKLAKKHGYEPSKKQRAGFV